MDKKKIIMIIACVVVIAIIIILLVTGNGEVESSEQTTSNNSNVSTSSSSSNATSSSKIEVEANEEGNVVIDTTNISKIATFYTYTIDDVEIEFFAVKASDGTIRMAFNTCQVCSPSPKAYFKQSGTNFICQNCKNSFATDNIGVEKGGCNPIPITEDDRVDSENTITITKDFIESYKDSFDK